MPPRPIINDALWRCLCPRYTQLPAQTGVSTIAKSAAATRIQTLRCTAPPKAARQQLRPYNTSTQPARDFAPEAHVSLSSQRPTNAHGRSRGTVPLVHLPTPELYNRLRLDGAAGECDEVMSTIRILIKDRREMPNLSMYTAMLHSFANCTEATAGAIRKVLDEMQETGVELDARAAERALEALAVHPDHMLRTDILEYMKERWFSLSDRGHNFVVAGMLRDRLFEQALEKLEDMIRQRIKVEQWLWDKAMWMLLEFGEVEEAVYVLSLRQSASGAGELKLSNVMWLQLLDAAGRKHLYNATNMVWTTQVIPGYIKAPTGTCLNVLSIAARAGDVKLATDVFRVLSERNTLLTSSHYEALIECYLTSNDLFSAISIILIMQDSGLRITPEALHPLYTHLSKDETRPMEAFKMLQELADGGKKVPLVAVNACIQACIARSLDRLLEAVEMYKALHSICPNGPNTATFNLLFQGCSRCNRRELAMFLANEMIQLGIEPDALTYDRLILVCLVAKDVKDALTYYEEMRSMGWVPREGTCEVLIKAAVKVGDSRAVAVVKDFEEKGGEGERLPHWKKLVEEKFENGGVGKDDDGVAELKRMASAGRNKTKAE